MRDRKLYCREGESESHIALGWAVLYFMTVVGVILVLKLIGVI